MKHICEIIAYVCTAAVLFSFASCDKGSCISDTESHRDIAFGVSCQMKSAVEDAGGMNAFIVWGGNEIGDATNVFNGTLVSKNGSMWNYDYPRYWIQGKSYRFMALYPPDGLNAVCGKDGILRVSDFDCSSYGEDAVDLMIATAARDYDGTNSGAVGLDFNHLLSRINISVKSSGNRVTVKEAMLYGVNYQGTWTSPSPGSWSDMVTATEVSGKFMVTSVAVTEDMTSVFLFEDLLLIPIESLDGVILKLKYGYEGDSREYETHVPLKTDKVDCWTAGQMYAYTVTLPLNVSDIILDVSLLEWEEENTSVSWGS